LNETQVGVKAPINDKIVELVNAPGVGLLKPERKNLDPSGPWSALGDGI
jgi:hypothetical protein